MLSVVYCLTFLHSCFFSEETETSEVQNQSWPRLIRSTRDASHEDLGQRVGTGAAHVALGWVKRHIMDGLVELPAVGGELLDARSALHVPQTDGTVVT